MKRWSLLGRAFLFVVCSAVVLAVTSSAMRNLSQTWSPLVIGIVASAATFALTVIFVRWEGLRLADVGAAPGRGSIARFGVGFLLGLILVASHSAVLSVTGHVHWVRGPRVSAGVTIIALFGYVALACREELSFRGYPLRRLWKPFGLWGAQVIVAILFAIEHVLGGVPWVQALIGAAVGSLLFGMAAIATRGLAVPIGLHAAWNYGQWVLGEKESAGIWKQGVEDGLQGRADVAGHIGYLTVVGIATLAFWWWNSRSTARESERSSPVSL
ncbi:MAG: type II CAAX endopeptidase family protein [Gemmatimonadaceae bacterium]